MKFSLVLRVVPLFFLGVLVGWTGNASALMHAKCPQLAGKWMCALYINGDLEASVTEYFEIKQTTKPDRNVEYEIGGETMLGVLTDQALPLSTTVGACWHDVLTFNFNDELGELHRQTFTRPSAKTLRVQILNVKPADPLGNNDVTRVCELIP